jgi:RNA polymerase sigma-70 factor (ECF subfamily)
MQDAEADDIAQNVLLKVVRAMQQFEYDPNHRFSAWLRTITRNAVRDAMRSQRVHEDQATGDSQVWRLLENHPAAVDQLEDAMTQALRRDLMRDAERVVQERVEPHTWHAYQAAADGKAAKLIAADLRMSTAAVYKAKSKVVRMLREQIAALLKHDSM